MPLSEQMSDFIQEANKVLDQMRLQNERAEQTKEFHDKQLQMYSEKIDMQVDLYEKRICDNEKKTGTLRTIVWGMVVVLFGTIMASGIGIVTKPSLSEVEDLVKKSDYATRSDVIGGIYSTIDDVYEVFERRDILSHDDAYLRRNESKQGAYKEVTGYRTRSIK